MLRLYSWSFLRNKYFLTILRLLKRSDLSFFKSLGSSLQERLDPNKQTFEKDQLALTRKNQPRYVHHRSPNGLHWFLNLNDHIDYRLFLNEVWDVDLIEVSKKILSYRANKSEELFCIDIGAHIGTWSLPVSFLSDFVISFEPASKSFYRLIYNLELNQVKNVFPIRSAVVPCGTSILNLNFNATGNSGKSSLLEGWSHSNIDKEEILGLEASVILEKLPSIAIIKIDAEGYEFEILDSLKKVIVKHQSVIIFEWRSDYYKNVLQESEYSEKVENLLNFFEEAVYVLVTIDSKSKALKKFEKHNQYENVYCIPSHELDQFIGTFNYTEELRKDLNSNLKSELPKSSE